MGEVEVYSYSRENLTTKKTHNNYITNDLMFKIQSCSSKGHAVSPRNLKYLSALYRDKDLMLYHLVSNSVATPTKIILTKFNSSII